MGKPGWGPQPRPAYAGIRAGEGGGGPSLPWAIMASMHAHAHMPGIEQQQCVEHTPPRTADQRVQCWVVVPPPPHQAWMVLRFGCSVCPCADLLRSLPPHCPACLPCRRPARRAAAGVVPRGSAAAGGARPLRAAGAAGVPHRGLGRQAGGRRRGRGRGTGAHACMHAWVPDGAGSEAPLPPPRPAPAPPLVLLPSLCLLSSPRPPIPVFSNARHATPRLPCCTAPAVPAYPPPQDDGYVCGLARVPLLDLARGYTRCKWVLWVPAAASCTPHRTLHSATLCGKEACRGLVSLLTPVSSVGPVPEIECPCRWQKNRWG